MHRTGAQQHANHGGDAKIAGMTSKVVSSGEKNL
jgi:hypothetical protein